MEMSTPIVASCLLQWLSMSERPAFTPLEEAFFRAGENQEQNVETFSDLEEGEPRRPFFRRLFSRKQNEQ
jgi:hypothetical protein